MWKDLSTKMNALFQNSFVRYVITGGTAFLVEYGLYLILIKLTHLSPVPAAMLVYTVVFLVTFVMTRTWTFRSNGRLHWQFVAHFGLFVFNLLIGNYFLFDYLLNAGVSKYIAPFIKTALITCWNFLIFRYLIYPKRTERRPSNE